MTYDIYGVENNLASGLTRVRFRVWQQLGELTRLVDDCAVVLEGRYDLDHPDLPDLIQTIYVRETSNG